MTNTGDKFGKEIVQLYVADKTEAIRRPEKELKGFEKVALNPGETKRVTFTLDKRSFAWYNTDIHDWYAASGEYDILIAASSRDVRLTKTIQWESTQVLPLHLHLNTTMGELLSDERTKALGKELKDKMNAIFFGGSDGGTDESTDGDKVVSDDMGDAVLGGDAGSAVLMLFVTIVAGAVLGLVSGGIYVLLRIPPIITSLGVTLIYEGIMYTITNGKYVMAEVQNPSMSGFVGTWIYAAAIIVVVLILSIVIFDYTRFGYDYKALKDGQKVAVNTGIREIPNTLICYTICGALMGTVGFLNAARNTTINGGQLNFSSIAIMFTAFLPMFIGSYISRYSNEKVGFLLAAVCMSLLNSTFAVLSNVVTASMQSIINAVLLVVFLIYLNNEKLLVKIFFGRRN